MKRTALKLARAEKLFKNKFLVFSITFKNKKGVLFKSSIVAGS